MITSAAAIAVIASVKGRRQHPLDFFCAGFWEGTRALGRGISTSAGRFGAGAGFVGIFFPISSALLEGRTRVGVFDVGLLVLGPIFWAILSALLTGRTLVGVFGVGLLAFEPIFPAILSALLTRERPFVFVGTEFPGIFPVIFSALLTRFRPLRSFIAIFFFS